ncbi:MAG TPA: hypothetical protein DEQ14_04785 [Treponema sp.]|nr:hypothetical protein [Treponema sp.]
MERASKVFGVIALLVVTGLLAIGCQNPEAPDQSLTSIGVPITRTRYVANHRPTEFVNSYSYGNTDYYIYYIGNIEDNPISYEAADEYWGIPFSRSYSNKSVTISTVSESERITTTQTKTNTQEVLVKAELDLGLIGKIGKFLGLSAELSAGWSGTWTTSEQVSTERITSSATTWAEEHEDEISYTLSGDMPHGFYRYTLFAQCDVYAVLKHDEINDIWSYDFFTCPRENTYINKIAYYETVEEFYHSTSNSSLSFDIPYPLPDPVPDDQTIGTYIVSFNPIGGSDVLAKSCPAGNKITAPDIPIKHGYIFDGWYTEQNYINQVTFPYQPPHNGITLYAKWQLKTSGSTTIRGSDFTSLNALPDFLLGTAWTGWYDFNTLSNIVKSAGFEIDQLKAAGYTRVRLQINYDSSGDPSGMTIQLRVQDKSDNKILRTSGEMTPTKPTGSFDETFSIYDWDSNDTVEVQLRGIKKWSFTIAGIIIKADRKYTLTFMK